MVDAEPVEGGGDLVFLGHRKLDALGLLAVAEGGVEEIETLADHGCVHAWTGFGVWSFKGLWGGVSVVLRIASGSEAPPRT